MKKLVSLFVALCMVFMMIPALAEKESDGKIIRVGGNATVSLAADTATLRVGVNTRDESVRAAQKENADLTGGDLLRLLHVRQISV